MFDLILTTESKVLSCNISDFQKQAEKYISTLTQEFNTDDDFATAKEEVKQLKELEDKTRSAIDSVLNGNKDVSELIETAKEIAEKFRAERLTREKLVKEKEEEVKGKITKSALDEITVVQSKQESSISLAMSITMPKSGLIKRITESAKNKRTIDGLNKSVNAEKTLILAEIALESARLKERLRLIPIAYEHLFKDSIKLIAGDDDLSKIVADRIEGEKRREAELIAVAELEAKAKAEREAEEKANQVETDKASEQVTEQKENKIRMPSIGRKSTTENDIEFEIKIPFVGSLNDAIKFAKTVKSQYGDGVKLTKLTK